MKFTCLVAPKIITMYIINTSSNLWKVLQCFCEWNPIIIDGIFVWFRCFVNTLSQEECQRGGCFPATGDLLVGRENRISASSTCGLTGREEYCIISFLNKKEKCFFCESTREVDATPLGYRNSHLPKYMVTSSPKDRLKGWWQAQNGKQEVQIQVDLEAEFVFTHLIMTFKTFRPKSMYIERSWNYGKDWSVYRYFAFSCAKSFPGVPTGPQRNIDDVICEERYSKVEPSTEGEVVMKVLDPIIQQQEDPYSLRVQNLLKLTNLRVKFTELHTFGDDVLGDNTEVNQKYYYSLYEMVVRGSCSCYGHAEHCIPAENTPANVNMVHGKCNCTHFTTGRNCERCMDGYADEPWRPAYKGTLNVCRKCNCNAHTDKCHFDPAVYNATGGSSGGVCDDCQHNTAGRQCETCKPLYYRDPFKDIFDSSVCKPCDCDPAGSIGGGECETVASTSSSLIGRCLCKNNAEGTRCDQCKDGFWNMLESNQKGCQTCGCDDRGTVGSNKCDQQTGSCRCLRYVKGRTCSKCSDGFWALGTTPEGCKPCKCDPGGAKSSTCDDVSGMCQCKQYLTGRQCNEVRPGFYVPNLDNNIFEAEDTTRTEGSTTSVYRRIHDKTGEVQFTGVGYLQVEKGSVVEFDKVTVPYSGRYHVVIRYENLNEGDWDDVRITVRKQNGARLGENDCAPFDATEQILFTELPSSSKAKILAQTICLEKGSVYELNVDFRANNGRGNIQTILDSLLLFPNVGDLDVFAGREGSQRRKIYDQFECRKYYLLAGSADKAPQECKDIQFSIASEMHDGALACKCNPTGTLSSGNSDILTCNKNGGQCPCKPGVGGRRCDRCLSGYFGFGAEGCTACDCSSVGSTSPFCHDTTGRCPCKPQLEGRKCDSCPVNHFGFPNCKPCSCNGHSDKCDVTTGQCTGCKHNTDGFNCDMCAEGFYGDAMKGTVNDCKRCQCPGGSSGNQFSNICSQTPAGTVICNNCTEGYSGDQCERCTDGYYGNPLTAGGSCNKCECNGNIDPFASNKCDPETGVCNACINNAAGDHCENCKEGFFGNAKNQTCEKCVCNELGTDDTKGACDATTGQCPCLPNVSGLECDRCAPGFYNLASGEGCEECNCDKDGSLEGSCNQMDGQCRCRVGFGGRDCSECEDFSWGDPKSIDGCTRCGCNPIGSVSTQCNRTTGVCTCKDNVIGEKCDMCAPRTSGIMPKCENCHTCNDQWEDIVSELEKKITYLIKLKGNFTFNVSEIELYSKEIQKLKDNLKMIEEGMENKRVKGDDVDDLRRKVGNLTKELVELDAEADKYVTVVTQTEGRTTAANDELDTLDIRFYKLKVKAETFKHNVTKLIESNIGGALNSTRDSLRRSRLAQGSVDESAEKVKQSKKLRKKIMREIVNGEPTFEVLHNENNELVDNLTKRIGDLESELKKLNTMLCGGGEGCGECTANGCETCGGGGEGVNANCTGAKGLAANALSIATEAKEKLLKKKADAEEILDDVREAEKAIAASKAAAGLAERSSKDAKIIGEKASKDITTLVKDIRDFLAEDFKHPNLSRALALDTLTKNISLTPEEAKVLAEKIVKAVNELKGVPEILNESRKDYLTAINLKKEALRARDYALSIMNKTERILGMLSKAAELQNSTAQMVSVARANIGELLKLIEQIKEKQAAINDDLTKSKNETGKLEEKRDGVKAIFDENKENLPVAEKEAERAEDLANQVNETSSKLRTKYDTVQQKLKEKQDDVAKIRERLQRLGDGAIDLFKKALLKLELINELKTKYNRNEERVQDLLDELRRLEIRVGSSRNKLQTLSSCHSTCNANILGNICEGKLKEEEEKEKNRLDAHDSRVKSRQ